MADTYEKFTTTGQTVFTLPFSSNYLLKSHVKVYKGRDLLLETQTATLSEGTDYTFSSATQITLSTGLASGEELTIQRQTPEASQLSPWNDGSNLTAEALNKADLQCLYVVQEQSDLNALNAAKAEASKTTATTASTNASNAVTTANAALPKAGGSMTGPIAMGTNKITGLGDPTAAQDAVTKAYLERTGSIQSAQIADGTIVNADVNASAAIAQSKLDIANATTSASGYMSAADKTKLDGCDTGAKDDQTASEIRALVDSATNSNVYTDAEKTKLSGIDTGAKDDQTASEIKALYEDSGNNNATYIKTTYESNAQTNALTDAEKAVIDGVTANTSELNKLDGVTASTTELNIVAGKSFRASTDGALSTTSDTEMPSSKVIANHVAAQIGTVGGFTTITNDASFPATASQPANGVIISISDAQGIVVSGTTSTTGRTVDGTPATVTINNFPSSLTGETLASGVGLLVTSTGSGNIYNYHKLLAAESDVKQLSDDINDFAARYRVAALPPGSNNDEGDLYFDTAANKMKVYNGSSWDDVASVGSFFVNTLSSSSGTGGGSATFNDNAYRFTLSNAGQSAQQHIVSVNGVVQKPNSGTSQPSEGFAIDGNDIIFSAAPATNSDFFIITSGSSVSIGTPSANSVNSSHIIDGSIVNGDISNSANIALSKLNTTGTPSNSNYLRGDGAWSTIDLTNFTNDVTFTGDSSKNMFWDVSDGQLELSTGVNITLEDSNDIRFINGWSSDGNTDGIYFGASGSEILTIASYGVSGGSVKSVFHSTAAQGVEIKGSKFRVQNTVPNDLIYSDGAYTKLYHSDGTTSSEKLATTSTGIDVTGAITVNGAALSAAPEITATADGAIAAGQPVIMKSDGDVTKVKLAITVNNPPSVVSDRTQLTANNFDKISSLYIPELKKIIVAGKNESSGDDLEMIVGEVDDTGSFTWGSVTQIETDRLAGDPGLVYDPSTQRLVVLYYCDGMSNPEYSIFSRVLTLSGNTISNIGSRTTLWNQDGGSFWGTKLVYDPDNQKIVAVYRRGGGNNPYSAVGTVTGGSTNTVSWGTPVQITSENTGMLDATYDPDTNRVLMVTRGPSSVIDVFVGTVSGTSISWGSAQEVLASSGNYPEICYDTENQKAVVVYKDGSSNLVAKVGTVTGGSTNSISWGSATSAWYPQSDGGNSGSRCLFDSYTGRVVVHTIGKGSEYKLLVASGLVSGSSITWTNDADQENDRVTEQNAQTFVIAEKGRVVSVYRNFDKSNDLYSTSAVIGTGASNMTTANFVGFAKAAANDNATATIDVTGSTNSSQTSLTPGLGYYVQDNGTLGTTASDPEQFAGTAISATKLLVRGYPPAPAGVGEWTKLLSGDKAYSSGAHDFVDGFNSTYSAYKWFKIAWHFRGDGDSVNIGVRVKDDDGTVWGNNQYNRQQWYQVNGSSMGADNNGSNNEAAAWFNTYAYNNAQGETHFFDPLSGDTVGMAFVSNSEGWDAGGSGNNTGALGTGFRGHNKVISSLGTSYNPIHGLQWYFSHNIKSLYWVLYGRN